MPQAACGAHSMNACFIAIPKFATKGELCLTRQLAEHEELTLLRQRGARSQQIPNLYI